LNNLDYNLVQALSNSLKVIELRIMKQNYLNYVYTFRSYDTFLCYKGHLEQILNYLVSKFNIIYDIDVKIEYLFKFIQDQRKKGLSSATINKRINVFKRMFKYSKSYVDLSDVKNLKEKYTTYNYLNDDEILKLLDYIKNSKLSLQNKLMLSLFLESGVRKKELRHIEISNIDLSTNTIFLTVTKLDKPRVVCFGDLTLRYLLSYLKTIKNKKYLFNLSNTAISDVFRRIKDKLNFDNFSPYVLRHSYATIIVNNDGNLEMLRQTMGHQKLTTTQRYMHYNRKLLSESYRKSFKIK